MNKIFFALLLSITILNAFDTSSCSVDNRIMYAIAKMEGHPKKNVGYPYLISFNIKSEASLIKQNHKFKKFFLDRRSIDCKNKETCVNILKFLTQNKIKNIDLGAFSLNYKFFKMNYNNYFDIEKSYHKSCSIIEFHNKKEWSWDNIAKYHSKTPHLKEKYKNKLISIVNNIVNNENGEV